MEIELNKKLITAITKDELKQFGIRDDDFRWRDEVRIDLKKLKPNQIQDLQELLEKNNDVWGAKTCLKNIEVFLGILDNKMPRLTNVKMFESALIQYLLPSERRWLYKKP